MKPYSNIPNCKKKTLIHLIFSYRFIRTQNNPNKQSKTQQQRHAAEDTWKGVTIGVATTAGTSRDDAIPPALGHVRCLLSCDWSRSFSAYNRSLVATHHGEVKLDVKSWYACSLYYPRFTLLFNKRQKIKKRYQVLCKCLDEQGRNWTYVDLVV